MEKIKKKHKLTLFGKYFIVISLVILICFGVLGSSLLLFVSQYWAGEKSKLLAENAKSVALSTSELLTNGFLDISANDSIVMLCSSLDMISTAIDADVFVCDTSGMVILCRDLVKDGYLLPQDGNCDVHGNYIVPKEIMDKACEGSYADINNLGGLFEDNHFVNAEPVRVFGHTTAVVFAVEPTMTSIVQYVFSIFRMFAFSAFVALLIAFFAVYLLTYSFTKPLRDMAAATKRYAAGDFSYRISSPSNDELGQLERSFNTMANDLSQLESSRRSFIANVSHELKTPMTTIGGFIDGILDGTIPHNKQDEYLAIVSDEVKRLSRIVVSMLNLSKIEAGQLDLKISDVDLSSLLVKTMLSFEQKIESEKIDIVGLEPEHRVCVPADEDMINQVIYNLIDNAVKFTPSGGVISVSATKQDGEAVVRIKNTGAGISSEELPKIFERFYKVDKSRSYDTKSTGLGLYIVKSILELHGGTIRVESVYGEYTEFIFTLPLKIGG